MKKIPTPLTDAAVMRAGQGLGWTEVIELAEDLERRIQKLRNHKGWLLLLKAFPGLENQLDAILTRSTVRKAKVLTKPQGASLRQYAKTKAKLKTEKPYALKRKPACKLECETSGDGCEVCSPGWKMCCRKPGHTGPHVACNPIEHAVETWPKRRVKR